MEVNKIYEGRVNTIYSKAREFTRNYTEGNGRRKEVQRKTRVQCDHQIVEDGVKRRAENRVDCRTAAVLHFRAPN